LVKVCHLVQNFKYGQANSAWRSKKIRFKEEKCDKIVGLCGAGSVHSGNLEQLLATLLQHYQHYVAGIPHHTL
jgi:hypothetical protein